MAKSIVKVKLLGVSTGMETGVFATYNFPVYSFWIQYDNGSSTTVQLANKGTKKAEINRLLKLAQEDTQVPATVASGKDVTRTFSSTSARDKSAIFVDLKTIKDLYDTGVLTLEQYEKERYELMKELEEIQSASEIPNIRISRMQPRPNGEAKTVVYIDSIRRADLDLDKEVILPISAGEHTILFERVAIRSKKFTFEIKSGESCHIFFAPKFLSIAVDIKAK